MKLSRDIPAERDQRVAEGTERVAGLLGATCAAVVSCVPAPWAAFAFRAMPGTGLPADRYRHLAGMLYVNRSGFSRTGARASPDAQPRPSGQLGAPRAALAGFGVVELPSRGG